MGWLSGLDSFVRQREPMAPHTWFQLGGPAEFFAEPRTEQELMTLLGRCHEQSIPVRVLGGGSNVLVQDEGVKGMVIHLADPNFAEIDVQGTKVRAGGGAKLGHLISTAVREGLAGLEPLVGIPGTVGGALHGNSGGKGGDVGQWTTRATVITASGERIVRERGELVFAYRESSLDELLIVSAEFELERGDPEELTKQMQKQWIVKRASQPLGHQSAGCIFKNPPGLSAGMLIDQSGLKGTKVGGAEVSDRHANFIVAEQGASSADVLKLIELVRSRVADHLGVTLETEIKIW